MQADHVPRKLVLVLVDAQLTKQVQQGIVAQVDRVAVHFVVAVGVDLELREVGPRVRALQARLFKV